MEPERRKFLWLVRHGKSAWPDGVPDMRRPLNRRGRRDGRVMSKVLSELDNRPQKIFASDAIRTWQTARLVNANLENEIELTHDLYMAGVYDVEEILGRVEDQVESVAMVTHLPTIQRCIWTCREATSVDKFPTLGIVCFSHQGDWASFRINTSKMGQVMMPKAFQ